MIRTQPGCKPGSALKNSIGERFAKFAIRERFWRKCDTYRRHAAIVERDGYPAENRNRATVATAGRERRLTRHESGSGTKALLAVPEKRPNLVALPARDVFKRFALP
jgi:hypothetical protein